MPAPKGVHGDVRVWAVEYMQYQIFFVIIVIVDCCFLPAIVMFAIFECKVTKKIRKSSLLMFLVLHFYKSFNS